MSVWASTEPLPIGHNIRLLRCYLTTLCHNKDVWWVARGGDLVRTPVGVAFLRYLGLGLAL